MKRLNGSRGEGNRARSLCFVFLDSPLGSTVRVERSVRPHTIIDYLCRLRVKANYLDSTVFTEGPDDVEVSRRVLEELKDISANTLLVDELHIRSLVQGKLDSIADEWLESRASPPNVGLLLRREHW